MSVGERIKAKVAARRANAYGAHVWGVGRLATVEEIECARALRAEGASVRAIARALGVSKSQVARFLRSVGRGA